MIVYQEGNTLRSNVDVLTTQRVCVHAFCVYAAKAAVDKDKNSLKRLSEDLRGLVNDKTYADVAFIIEGEDRSSSPLLCARVCGRE
jgi:ATP phosphoribosyltransferase